SQLFLSSDDTPAKATTPIAEVTTPNDPFQEPPHQATSTPISLIASNLYYIYAVWKEAGGEDFCDVAWRKVGDAAVAKYLPYIPGTVLETLADPRTLTLPALTISSPAEGSSFPIGATVTLT